MKKHKNLIAPSNYWNKTNQNTFNFPNSCGGQGVTSTLVPDNLIGLNISQACDIHDFMYEQGKNKKRADKVFLRNMLSLVDHNSDSTILKSLRKAKAYIYYFAVKLFGGSFFRASHKSMEENTL